VRLADLPHTAGPGRCQQGWIWYGTGAASRLGGVGHRLNATRRVSTIPAATTNSVVLIRRRWRFEAVHRRGHRSRQSLPGRGQWSAVVDVVTRHLLGADCGRFVKGAGHDSHNRHPRSREPAPLALRANVEHNHVRHQHVVIVAIEVDTIPRVSQAERLTVDPSGGTQTASPTHVTIRFGYTETPDAPATLARLTPEQTEGSSSRPPTPPPMQLSISASRETGSFSSDPTLKCDQRATRGGRRRRRVQPNRLHRTSRCSGRRARLPPPSAGRDCGRSGSRRHPRCVRALRSRPDAGAAADHDDGLPEQLRRSGHCLSVPG
jgi:hypothetical protein